MLNRVIRSSVVNNCMRMDKSDNVSFQDCDEGKNTWDLELTGSNGSIYTIANNDRKRCLQPQSGQVRGFGCNDNEDKQMWKFIDRGGSTYQIKNEEKKTCMQMKNNGDVVLTKCSSRDRNQQFRFARQQIDRTNGRIKNMAEKDKCMKVKDSEVKVGSCSRGDVTWKYDVDTRQFKNENGSNMCLDAGDRQSRAATISRCDENKKNQEWTKRANTIYSVSSRQCLKLNSSTDKFNLRDCGDGDSFQFKYENVRFMSWNKSVE